jgi:hypothetical protein
MRGYYYNRCSSICDCLLNLSVSGVHFFCQQLDPEFWYCNESLIKIYLNYVANYKANIKQLNKLYENKDIVDMC